MVKEEHHEAVLLTAVPHHKRASMFCEATDDALDDASLSTGSIEEQNSGAIGAGRDGEVPSIYNLLCNPCVCAHLHNSPAVGLECYTTDQDKINGDT
jgi:hypothetical protein